MDAMVRVQNLKKSFKRRDGTIVHAVKGVNFEIKKGEIFSLLGPNGAGKTTAISMISGLIEAGEGDAFIGEYSIRHQPMAAKSLIGVVPQEIALYPELSARQNLWFFGRMYGLRGGEIRRRIDDVLEFIDLTDRQHDRVETFSGGMKRRVNIGVGLLNRPQLVFMDEPTVGIDPQNRRRILDTVFRLRDEYGMSVLYTTHLMEEAEELSDRVGIIDHGEIIALGSQAALTQQIGEEDRLTIAIAGQFSEEALLNALNAHPAVTRAEIKSITDESTIESATLNIFVQNGRSSLASILQLLEAQSLAIESIDVRHPDLEALFLHITGRALRD